MNHDPTQNFLASDAPIDGVGRPDLLSRELFTEQVARRIVHAGTGESVVFGLSGPWGAGKTSALALIKNAIEVAADNGAGQWKIVEFTPWAATDSPSLTEEFYNTIALSLHDLTGADGRALKKAFIDLAKASANGLKEIVSGVADHYLGDGTTASVVTAFGQGAIDRAGDFQFEEDPFAARFEKISGSLESIDLRVLVIVDDIDRLHHEELLAVMKAVRLLGRFKGIHYLLSYDIDTVADVLSRSDLARGNRRRAERYLEKIVQYPFELPPIQEVHLAEIIRRRLQELIDQYTLEGNSIEYFLDVILTCLPLREITVRLVNRLFAQVDVLLALASAEHLDATVAVEVDLLDAVLLTYLRLEFHELYQHLPAWKSKLTYPASGAVSVDAERSRQDGLAAQVQEALDPKDEKPSEVDVVLTVLRALFPEAFRSGAGKVPDTAPLQIRQASYFDRYFTFGIPAGDISNGRVRYDLIQLLETGSLPDGSVIRSYGEDRVRAILLYGKIREMMPEVVRQSSSTDYFDIAARVLTSVTIQRERAQPSLGEWWSEVAAHLWSALVESGIEKVKAAISSYLSEFGIDMTAIAAFRFATSTDDAGWDAANLVWLNIRDEFVSGLFDGDPSRPDASSAAARLKFWVFNVDPLFWDVREAIEQRLAAYPRSGWLVDLAARLVTVQFGAPAYEKRLAFDISELTRLINPADWPSGEIPHSDQGVIDRGVVTYENARRLAAREIYKKGELMLEPGD